MVIRFSTDISDGNHQLQGPNHYAKQEFLHHHESITCDALEPFQAMFLTSKMNMNDLMDTIID